MKLHLFESDGNGESIPASIMRELEAKKDIDVGEKRHPFLKNPKEWLRANAVVWKSCFREQEPQSVIIGCADRRVGHRANLRYPGLGIFAEDFDQAAQKIIGLLTGSFRGRQAVLLSHDDCAAALHALKKHSGDETDVDSLAAWWGKELAKRINEKLGDQRVRHEHLQFREMKKAQDPMEVIYVDCTDRFNPQEQLAQGPTISLLNPGGIRFSSRACLGEILGNSLRHHILPELDCIIKHIFEGKNAQYGSFNRFSYSMPLTIVLVYDTNRETVSEAVQNYIQSSIAHRHCRIRLVPIDEKGTVRDLPRN